MAKWESAPVYTPKWASAPTYETPRNRPVADEEEPGFLKSVGTLVKQGAEQAMTTYQVGPQVISGGVEGTEGLIAKNLGAERFQPEAMRQVSEAFKDEGEAMRQAESWYSPQGLRAIGGTLAEIGKQIVTNPRGVAYFTAEQAANMVPAIVGGLSGAAAGSPAGPVGAVGGGAVGAFGASVPMEIGAEFIGIVGGELAARNLAPTEENIKTLLTDEQFRNTAISQARVKGATVAAVDAATSVIGGRIASGPMRSAVANAARESIETGAEVAPLVQRNIDALPFSERFVAGAKGYGVDVAGAGVGETAGQVAAYGEADLEEVALEVLGEAGGAIVEVPALGKKFVSAGLRTVQPGESIPVEPGPVPAEVSPEQATTFARTRLRELITKGKGTPDISFVDPATGQTRTTPGRPAENLSDNERTELEFLANNAENPSALGKAYNLKIKGAAEQRLNEATTAADAVQAAADMVDMDIEALEREAGIDTTAPAAPQPQGLLAQAMAPSAEPSLTLDTLAQADVSTMPAPERQEFLDDLTAARTANLPDQREQALQRAAETYGRTVGPIQDSVPAAPEPVRMDMQALVDADTRSMAPEDRTEFVTQLNTARTAQSEPVRQAALTRAAEVYGRAVSPVEPRRIAAPRPTNLLGRRAEQYTDTELQALIDNDGTPAVTRRGAEVELRARTVSTPQEETANVEKFITIPEPMPNLAAQPVAGQSAGQRARATAQRAIDNWAASRGVESPATFNPAPADLEANVTEIANLIGSQWGSQVVAFSDTRPGAINGVAIGKVAYVNVSDNQAGVQRTALHEFKHTVEQIAKAEADAGMVNTPAQDFVEQIDSVFDDITEEGKRAYLENFMAAEELASLEGEDRETRMQELLQDPELRSEMVADFLGNRATDKKFWQDLAKADPTGFEAFVKRWLTAIDNLLAKLRGAKGRSKTESAKVDTYIRDLNKAKLTAQSALINYRKATGQAPVATPAVAAAPQFSVKEGASLADTASLAGANRVSSSQTWRKGRDLKVALQQRVIDAAAAEGIDVSTDSPETREYLREVGMKDALAALNQNPNAIGWYDIKTRQALAVMSLVHPEIARDENARFAFTWALAVTSNGMKVDQNFELAEKVYDRYKREGVMPSNVGTGTAGKAINQSLAMFNELRDAWGIDNLRQFMQTNFTVSEITGLSKDLTPGGEFASTPVKGAAILGPKIGNGFFSNLYGDFTSLTMDRWLIRTWGRWTGTLIKAMPEQTALARTRLSNNVKAIVANKQEAARLGALIDAEITADMDVDQLSAVVQKASMDPKIRAKLNETDLGQTLRLAGNSLAKYLDGQKEAPSGPEERQYIRAVFNDILDELNQTDQYKDLMMADLQAVLWYAEKRLYETAKDDPNQLAADEGVEGYDDESAPDYANAAARIARQKGVTDKRINATLKRIENERSTAARSEDGVSQDAGDRQPAAVRGFTRQEKRKFIGERAVLRVRADRMGDAQSPGSYSSKGQPDGGRVRVLKSLGVSYTNEWKLNRDAATAFRANKMPAPEFLELASTAENAQKFAASISENKASHPFGAAVYVYSPEEYRDMRLFLAEDGKSGVAIKPDGDIVSVFSTGGARRAVMELAVAAGGRKLDAFDTILPKFYAPHGFRAVARTRWNDEFAPEAWNKDTFEEFNNGEPDVVFMVYDPAKMDAEYSTKDGKVMAEYDRAVSLQNREMKRLTPQFSRSQKETSGAIKATPGVDMVRMARLLGPQLYGNMSDIGLVTIKEVFQNSFDALKGAIQKGDKNIGRIDIDVDSFDRTITITDDGTGMTPETINKAFLTLAGTSKETDRASGGLGIAKMLFLFGNESLSLRTVRNGVESTLSTSGAELMASFSDPSVAPDIQTRSTSDPSGTTVTIKIPATYTDENGEVQAITFPYSYLARSQLVESPLMENIEVRLNDEVLPIGSSFPAEDYTVLANAKFAWGNMRVLVRPRDESEYGPNIQVLSNGLFQFDDVLKKNPLDFWGPAAPFKFYFNIEPSVPADSPLYPIALNRKAFSASAKADFDALKKYLGVLYANKTDAEDAQSFGELEQLSEDGKTFKRISLVVPEADQGSTLAINPGDKVEVREGRMYVNNREMPEITKESMAKLVRDPGKFRIDPSLIDPSRVLVHDNLTLSGVPFREVMRDSVGDAFDDFTFEVAKVFKNLRDAVAKVGGAKYSDVSDVAVGVSFDLEYYGVNIMVPFRAMMINPAFIRGEDPAKAAQTVVGTMIHELAHHAERNHSETGFIPELQRMFMELSLSRDSEAITRQLQNVFNKYPDIMRELRRIQDNEKENLKPKGVRLKGDADTTGVGGMDVGQKARDGASAAARLSAPGGARRDDSDLPGIRRAVEGGGRNRPTGEERRRPSSADGGYDPGLAFRDLIPQFSRGQKDVLSREPKLESAAQGIKEGTVTREQYDELVNALKPVTPYESAPSPATEAKIRSALSADKVDRIGAPSKTLKAGDPVGLRLDIPAYANHGVWVVSVHEQIPGFAAGKSIGYESVASVTNPTFGVVESAALNIAAGKPKATIAVMKGDWKPVTPKQASATAKLALKSDNWVQVGMDPTRHAYFYDRASMEPVVSADEAIQVGPLVLAKNPVYGDKTDFRFSRSQEPTDIEDARLNRFSRSLGESVRERAGQLAELTQRIDAEGGYLGLEVGDTVMTENASGFRFRHRILGKSVLEVSDRMRAGMAEEDVYAIEGARKDYTPSLRVETIDGDGEVSTGQLYAYKLKGRFTKMTGPRFSRAQTDTPAFKRWFGNSQLIDESGNPKVFYHNTAKNFTKFKPGGFDPTISGPAMWFGDDPAVLPAAHNVRKDTQGANVMPVYLRMERPLIMDDQASKEWARAAFADDWREFPLLVTDKIVKDIKDEGYDGIIFNHGPGETEYIVFDPTQIKSAIGNRGTFDPAKADIRFSLAQKSPLKLYSALARAVEAGPVKGQAQQWKGFLRNQKGVTPGEIEWSGVEDWLDLQSGSVSREAVTEFLAKNGVQVGEVVLGGTDVYPDDFWRSPFNGNEMSYDDWVQELEESGENPEEAFATSLVPIGGTPRATEGYPKYAGFQLPGGDNYREVLLTLPTGAEGTQPLKIDRRDDGAYVLSDEYGPVKTVKTLAEAETYRGRRLADDKAIAMSKLTREGKVYRSTHWDQLNVLAHIRMNDRVDADGNRVLFVEEMQSDWAQEGRKTGFATPETVEEYVRNADNTAWVVTKGVKPGIPVAPFVKSTNSWLNLALKRVIAMAVEGGYDKVAFINGEQSADRYDLSKQIDRLEVEITAPDNYRVFGYLGSDLVIDTGVSEDELPNTIGKELAEKVIANRGGVYDVPDLKVGGEGMKDFYDSIVPKAVAKLLPKIGGGKLEQVNLESDDVSSKYIVDAEDIGADEDFEQEVVIRNERSLEGVASFNSIAEAEAWLDDNDVDVSAKMQPGFAVTPAMTDQVMDVGLPMFSRAQNIFGKPMPAATWQIEDSVLDTKLIYVFQDKLVDTKRVVEAINSAVGQIEDKWDPYLQEKVYHGVVAKQTKDFAEKDLKPLIETMGRNKVTLEEFDQYLHNRHAEERNVAIAKRNLALPDAGSGIPTADARAYLSGLPAARRMLLEGLARKIDSITKGTRDILISSGLEAQSTIDAWDAVYKKYVPLMREELDYEGTKGPGTGRGISVRGSASRRAVGSADRRVVDIMANIAMQRERAIVRAAKNKVSQAVYGLALKNPSPDFWLPINPDGVKDPQALAAELINLGIDPLDAQNIAQEPKESYVDPRTGLVSTRVNRRLRGLPNVVYTRVNGKDRFLVLNNKNPRAERMAIALNNLDVDSLNAALRMAAIGTRWFASVNTQYNPIFGIINLARDLGAGGLNLTTTALADKKGEVISNSIPALRGIYKNLRGRGGQNQWSALWEDFQEIGGQTGFRDQFSQSEERARALQSELDNLSAGGLKKAGQATLNWLSDYNTAMENAVRLSAYKAALDKGLSKQRAAELAKDLTVNFNKKGSVSTQMGALYAFFNASVQGTTRMAQTLKGPSGKKIMYGGLLLGAVQAVALMAAGFEDDEPPGFIKERNLVIPIGGGDYLTWPMPLGFNVIPNVGRIATEWALSGFERTPDRAIEMATSFFDMFNPIGNAGLSMQTVAPTLADPFAALAQNKDWTGTPISREDLNSLAPTPGYLRARDSASWFATELARFFNLASGGTDYTPGKFSPTPEQLEYLAGQVTGGVGREVGKAVKTAETLATGEELPPYAIPLAGRLYGKTTGSAAESNRFYDNIRRMNLHNAELRGLRESRQSVGPYLRDNPDARLATQARAAYRQVQNLRRRKREMLERNASRESIRLIDQQITTKMMRFNERVSRIEN